MEIPTSRPSNRIRICYFDGKTFQFIIDSYSKWVEIEIMLHEVNQLTIRLLL